MKLSNFEDEIATKTAGEILSKLKNVVENEDHTACQELKFFQSTREHFDAMDQRKGTIYEKRFREYTQKWLTGEV